MGISTAIKEFKVCADVALCLQEVLRPRDVSLCCYAEVSEADTEAGLFCVRAMKGLFAGSELLWHYDIFVYYLILFKAF